MSNNICKGKVNEVGKVKKMSDVINALSLSRKAVAKMVQAAQEPENRNVSDMSVDEVL